MHGTAILAIYASDMKCNLVTWLILVTYNIAHISTDISHVYHRRYAMYAKCSRHICFRLNTLITADTNSDAVTPTLVVTPILAMVLMVGMMP